MLAPYVHSVPVRYLEVDQQGVVFNMWYLAYIDDAMTGFLRHAGFDYGALHAAGLDVQLVHVTLDWKGSARFHDTVDIAVRPVRLGNTSFTLGFDLRVGEQPVLDATVVYVCIAGDGSGSRRLPEPLRAVFPAE